MGARRNPLGLPLHGRRVGKAQHSGANIIACRRPAGVARRRQKRTSKTRTQNEKGAQGKPRAPNPKPSLKAKDYLLEAAEAASAAAEPAAEAAESADEAAETAVSAADEASE